MNVKLEECRVFEIAEFGCGRSATNSFVLVEGRNDGRMKLWVAKMLLFRIEMSGGTSEMDEEESALFSIWNVLNQWTR